MEELNRYNKLCIKNKKLLSNYENLYNQYLYRYNEIKKKFGFNYNFKNSKNYYLLDEPQILLKSSKSIYDNIQGFTNKINISNDSKVIINNIKSLSDKFDDVFGKLEDKKIEHMEVFSMKMPSVSDMAGSTVDTIINGFKTALKEVFGVFDKILDIFNRVFDEVKNIALKVGNVVRDVMKELFGVMFEVFKFIKEKLIHYIMLAIEYIKDFVQFMFKLITKDIPAFYSYIKYNLILLYKEYSPIIKQAFSNFRRTKILSIILYIFVYINLRVATRYISGSYDFSPPPITIPIPMAGSIPFFLPTLNSIVSLIIVGNMLVYNHDSILFVHNHLATLLNDLFNHPIIKHIMNVDENEEVKMSHIVSLLMKNLPKVILFVIVILIIFKTFMNKGFRSFISLMDHKVSNAQF